MHAHSIVKNLLNKAMPRMHAKRREALLAVVYSALDGASLTVTSLGRGIGGSAFEKHRIKRADRLLSNKQLSAERAGIYRALARQVISSSPRPVIHIDWSNLDRGKTRYLLRAAVAVEGRAFTLYEEVHPRERFMKRRVERQFLERLAGVLGPQAHPIIVTDAGFLNPWRRAVLAMGWDFVCRIRGRVMLNESEGENWQHARSLYAQARVRAKRLMHTRLSRQNPLSCHFVLVRGKRGSRHDFNCYGGRARGHNSNKKARSQREPWLLATSLEISKASAIEQVVNCYRTRMQIEESFRDLKSSTFGLGYEAARSTRVERIELLLLVATLVVYLAWLIGLCVQIAGRHRRYQANTVTTRTVLSLVYLGRRAWRDHLNVYTSAAIQNAQHQLTAKALDYDALR